MQARCRRYRRSDPPPVLQPIASGAESELDERSWVSQERDPSYEKPPRPRLPSRGHLRLLVALAVRFEYHPAAGGHDAFAHHAAIIRIGVAPVVVVAPAMVAPAMVAPPIARANAELERA